MTTKSYGYTGKPVPVTIPAGVTSITITALGAAGGAGTASDRIPGGTVTATFPVTPGEVLQINVGQCPGTSINGGWNGGGDGGDESQVIGNAGVSGYGGGGASDVRQSGTALANRVIVGGGGGGGGQRSGVGGSGGKGGYASASGGANGGAGSGPTGGTVGAQGGRGASQSAGGVGGSGFSGNGAPGHEGAVANGGDGGSPQNQYIDGGGGGGGGYYGGGGGQAGPNPSNPNVSGPYGNGGQGAGGGGGGSSHYGSGTNASAGPGSGTGNGSVTIVYTVPYSPPNLGNPSDGATVDQAVATMFTWQQGTAGETYDAIQSVDFQLTDTTAGTTTTTNLSGNTTGYTLAAKTLVVGHSYKWRVRDKSSSTGNGLWSSYQTFTAQVNLITAPTLQAPTSGASPDGTQPIAFHWLNGTVTETGDTITSSVLTFIQNFQVIKTVTVPGAATSYTAAANLFPANQDTTWSLHNVGSNSGPGQESNTSDFTPTQTYYAPAAPTLQAPASGAVVDGTQQIGFTAKYNSTDNSNQSAYALKLVVAGATRWWDATQQALVSTETWNNLDTPVPPNGVLTVSLPAGTLANGNSDTWTMASQSASGGQLLNGPYATALSFTTAPGPTVTITAPVGTVGDTQPTTAWMDTITNGVQTTYRVVWERGSFGTAPGSGTSLADTGVVTSASTSVQSPVVLPTNTPLRTFVQIAQTGGALSPWAYKDFQTTTPPPNVPALTVAPDTDDNTGLPVVTYTVQGADAAYAATAFEVQRSDDGGQTWVDVRFAAALAPDGNDSATGSDPEVPFGGAPLFRAQTLDTSGTGNTSGWSPIVTTAVYADLPWIMDPTDPSTALAINWTTPADQNYPMSQDVTVVLDDPESIVESDVEELGSGGYQFIVPDPFTRATLRGLLASRTTLLMRSRNEEAYAGEATYFIRTGPVTVSRVGQNIATRLVSTSWQERSRPPVTVD